MISLTGAQRLALAAAGENNIKDQESLEALKMLFEAATFQPSAARRVS